MPKTSALRPSKPRSTNPLPTELSAPRQEIKNLAGRDGSSDGAVAPKTVIPARRLPTPEEIAARAYSSSEARRQSGQDGDELSDWLNAEAQLLGRSTEGAPTSRGNKAMR